MKHSNGKLILNEFFPYRLSVASYRTSRLIASVYRRRFGLKIPEWRVIAVLGEVEKATSTEIAEYTAMDKVAVSRAVNSLVKKELIIRSVSPKDARVAHSRLSRSGKRTYDEIAPLALDLESWMLEGLGTKNVEDLHAMFDQLGARLDEVLKL